MTPEIILSSVFSLIATMCGFLFFAIAAAVAFYLAFNARNKLRKVHTWPVTRGVIISSEAAVKVELNMEGRDRYHKMPEVRYTYSVAGRPYTGKRLTYAIHSMNDQKAEMIVAFYPVGKEVDVHYDPKDPSHACLEIQEEKGASSCVTIAGYILAFLALTSACGVVFVVGRFLLQYFKVI
jgi:hypothetical protein